MKTKTKLRFADLPKDYAALCRVFLPRPIHDATDYYNTAEVTDALALWRDDFTPGQRDYFDLLCSLIEDYDAEHVKWPRLKGRDILQHFLDQNGLAAADLSRILGGSRNLGAMILRGESGSKLRALQTLLDFSHHLTCLPRRFFPVTYRLASGRSKKTNRGRPSISARTQLPAGSIFSICSSLMK